MTLDDQDIERLRRNGFKVIAADGKNARNTKSDNELLRAILRTLEAQLNKPTVVPDAPKINVESPTVIVKPPEVTVNTPERPIVRKWLFEMHRRPDGCLDKIIATADD